MTVSRKGVGPMHLIIDGYGGNAQKMQDTELIYELLDRYPSEIGMVKLSPPQVTKYIGSKPEDWGISGFILIAESHISIHTFPERCYINIDVFSCKEFDPEHAIREFQRQFGLDEIRTYVLNRGVEYYNNRQPLKVRE
jgi:S-adenosylmethionine decarboxylase